MKMHQLAEAPYNISKEIVDLWIDEEGPTLLPIQIRAIEEQGLLAGRSLVIAAPSSAGKTFVAEIAMIAHILKGKRVFYIVPLKAMADEKYRLFKQRYSRRLGVEIVASTADLNEFDTAISRGIFDVAIVVNEKLDSILVQNPALIEQIGLVVIDEIQMIGEEVRGPTLEMLISKILALQSSIQLVGLSASLTGLDTLVKWLRASLVSELSRPVELREGVLYGSEFHYRCHNSNTEDTETWSVGIQAQDTIEDIIVRLLQNNNLMERPVIVFCPTRRQTIELAERIAREVSATRASEAISQLQSEIPETELTQKLIITLSQGVAFHSAELSYEVRELLEDQFRAGQIPVLCATSTLAMGINTPAKTVIFRQPVTFRPSRIGRHRTSPELLSPSTYKNMAGRAGRTKAHDDYGTSVLVALTQIDKMRYWQNLISAQVSQIQPQLFKPNTPLEIHILKLIATGICKTPEDVKVLLLNTLSGFIVTQENEGESDLEEKIQSAIKACIQFGLIHTAEKDFDLC